MSRVTVLKQTVGRLRQEYAEGGRAELFEALRMFQTGEGAQQSYQEVAAKLGIKVLAVKSAIYRMRQRHRHLLREEIAHTVATPAEVDEKIRYLLGILGG